MAWCVFVVNALRQLRHHFPRPRVVAWQHDAGIVNKQGVDIDDVAGYQLIVGALAERYQSAGDDVDKALGELAEGCRVTFAGKLSGEA